MTLHFEDWNLFKSGFQITSEILKVNQIFMPQNRNVTFHTDDSQIISGTVA
jgi:hypothetical protein